MYVARVDNISVSLLYEIRICIFDGEDVIYLFDLGTSVEWVYSDTISPLKVYERSNAILTS